LPVDGVDIALFAAATRVQVHKKMAKFWTSSKLNGIALAMMFSTLYKHSKRKNMIVANTMADSNWIRGLMHGLSPPIVSEYTLLWELVEAAGHNGDDQAEDDIIWTRTPDRVYYAKSAYTLQFEGSLTTTFPTTIWKIWEPLKCKLFIWLLLQCLIWTADMLQ
jgi:hypothetical protein